MMLSLGLGITVGSGVIMAMHIGAKDNNEAERVLGQSFVLSVIMAAFFTLIALVFSKQILVATGATGEIFEPAREYFLIVSGGSVLMFVMITIMFAFNSQGNTTTLTKLFALSTVINLVLDPLLIFGWGPVPTLGISGAALATLISQSVFMIIGIRSLSSEKRSIPFRFSNLTLKWGSVKKVLNIGFPAALTQVVHPIGLGVVTYITSLSFLEPGAIAFSLGFRIEFFAYLPAVGFGFGAMAMMGQNMGAGNMERTKEVFNKAVTYAFLGASGLGIAAALFARPLIAVFSDDTTVTSYTYSYMWTVALSYGFLAAMMVQANAFQSINRSWPGFWIYLLRTAGLSIPLSYLLTAVFNFSIMAVWLSVVAGNVISAVAGYFWVKRKLKKLPFRFGFNELNQ